jgi:Uma2 family endonuclease
MSTATRLITVAEYDSIPDPPGGRYELQHGELGFATFATKEEAHARRNVFVALFSRCDVDGKYFVGMVFACRPLPGYELWAVDVGVTTTKRWDAAEDKGWLAGSPELAIEILSPSNRKGQMQKRREMLFTGGCLQFWTVDTRKKVVAVFTPNGAVRTYSAADSISLEPYSDRPLTSAEIFAGPMTNLG